MSEKKTKQPREVEDFDVICDRQLADDDSITSATASYTGPDGALSIERVTWTDTVAKVWCAGGTDMVTYKVTIIIQTVNGRTIEADFYLYVKDR